MANNADLRLAALAGPPEVLFFFFPEWTLWRARLLQSLDAPPCSRPAVDLHPQTLGSLVCLVHDWPLLIPDQTALVVADLPARLPPTPPSPVHVHIPLVVPRWAVRGSLQ